VACVLEVGIGDLDALETSFAAACAKRGIFMWVRAWFSQALTEDMVLGTMQKIEEGGQYGSSGRNRGIFMWVRAWLSQALTEDINACRCMRLTQHTRAYLWGPVWARNGTDLLGPMGPNGPPNLPDGSKTWPSRQCRPQMPSRGNTPMPKASARRPILGQLATTLGLLLLAPRLDQCQQTRRRLDQLQLTRQRHQRKARAKERPRARAARRSTGPKH
jgi:hypothetical protein